MRPGLALALALVLLMAGCASVSGDDPASSPPGVGAPTPPAGCDLSLAVVAHRAGGTVEGIVPGATWTHTAAGCTLFDHETLFAGKPVTSPPSGHPNVVYSCAYMVGAAARAGTSDGCEKSLDGGLTWTPTSPITTPQVGPGNGGMPTCHGALAHGTAGSDGTIYVPHAQCGIPTLAISKDEGASWRNVKVSDLGMASYNNGFVDHEAGVGVDVAGNIYYVWDPPDRLPHLAISRDGGETWSTPMQIAAPELTQAVFPALAVGGDGKLAVVHIGSTNAPVAPFPKASCTPIRCTSEETDEAYAEVTWNGMHAKTDA